LVALFRQQYWNKIIDFDALLLAGGKTLSEFQEGFYSIKIIFIKRAFIDNY